MKLHNTRCIRWLNMWTNKRAITAGLVHVGVMVIALSAADIAQWKRWEADLTAEKSYANPFKDVTVHVEYRHESGTTLKTLGFWYEDNTFKIRCAFPRTGTWTWETACSNTAD
ncbi:MAG: DUF5060 domain-containing protein, partial [Chitinivibrionales bacterium]|nr:DUF5060 domain-containing protein [Chitinivibrionales bacterium]